MIAKAGISMKWGRRSTGGFPPRDINQGIKWDIMAGEKGTQSLRRNPQGSFPKVEKEAL
jgi:hypothetical protein